MKEKAKDKELTGKKSDLLENLFVIAANLHVPRTLRLFKLFN